MSDDQDITSPDAPEGTGAGQDAKSSSRPEEATLYRVNRLGSEIFVGDRERLLQAIQTRRIRGDDLIHDRAEDLWGFARKHPVFLEATGQAEEESSRARESSGRLTQWLRFLVNALLLGGLLYLLIAYSETIEFKINEERGEFGELTERSTRSGASLVGSQSDGSDGQGSSGEGGEGEGGGESEGEEGSASDSAMGEGEGGADPENPGMRREIVQIFDLSAEGMESNPLVLEQNTLSDDELVAQAQGVVSEVGHTLKEQNQVSRQSFTHLQSAYAIATFVETRNINHRGARNIREQIRAQLSRVCQELHSPRFCELKERQPRWSDTVISAIVRGEVLHGMTPPQVEAAWGRASRVRAESLGQRHCYGTGCERSALVVDGLVKRVDLKPLKVKRKRRGRRRQAARRRTP